MKRPQVETGIKIESNIRISTNVATSHKSFEVIVQSFFILLGVIGIVYSWIEGFSLSIDHKLFFTGLLITVIVHIGLNEIKRYQAAFFLLYFAVLGGLTYYNWAYIANGFYCLENAIIEKASIYYKLNPVRFVVKLDYVKSTTVLMLLIVQGVALVTALEIYKHYMRSIYLFLILLFYGGLLAVGITPSGSYMILVLLSFISFCTMDHIPGAYQKLRLFRKKNYHEMPGSGKQKLRIKAALIMIVCILIPILLVGSFVTKDFYDRHIDFSATKKELQKAIHEFSISKTIDELHNKWNDINPFSGDSSLASGGLDSGKLGDVGKIEFTGETALNLTVKPEVAYLYLKGFAGGEYQSDEWADLSDSEQDEYQDIVNRYGYGKYSAETLLWNWISFEIEEDTITIGDMNYVSAIPKIHLGNGDVLVDYVNANSEFLYSPYSSNYQLGELSSIGDQYMVSDEKKTRFLFLDSYIPYDQYTDVNQLFPEIGSILLNQEINQEIQYSSDYQEFAEFEEEYRNFVHEAYTRLPSQGLERLRSVQLEDTGTGIERTQIIIKSVITYLHEHADYSLSPGVPDKGEDFAEYFLFDKKEGFCSHYATAAVLLLRNYNVPARYIEGYIVTNQDITQAQAINDMKTVEVKDYNAHAWVEVYLDGVGWVPVEVTEGYADNGVSNLLPEIQETTQNSESTVQSSVTPTQAVSPTNKPQTTKAPTKVPSGKVPMEENETSNGITAGPSLWFLGIVSLLSVLISFFVHYLIKSQSNKKNLTRGLAGEQGIYCYERIEKLLREFKGIRSEAMAYEDFAIYAMVNCSQLPPLFDEVIKLALKAKFAKEGITYEEAARIREYYVTFYRNICQSEGKGKRFLFKYWKGY